MTKGLRSIRPLGADSLRGIEPAVIGKARPKFEWVNPRTLFVEEAYQRDISGNGTKLIRKIYAGFDWSRFKPPVCVRLQESGNALVCVDGQHTATAAASHPGIDKIPVMIVSADVVALRAGAFVGHNRDRLNLTPPMIYHAELAAGDPVATGVDRACRKAGATVLGKSINLREKQPVGSTIAIGTMKMLARKQGEAFLTRVLRVLVAAGRGPIKADEIAAVALIMKNIEALGSEKLNAALDGDLREIVASKTTEQWAAIGAATAAESNESLPSAVAAAWCDVMEIRLIKPTARSESTKGDATRFVGRLDSIAPPKPAAPPEPKESPSEVGLRAAKAAQSVIDDAFPQKAELRAAEKLDPVRFVHRNGVVLDLKDRTVQHRGRTVTIASEGIKMIASLARVMPSIMDAAVLARQTFGGAVRDPKFRIKSLVDKLNPILADARLEIKTVPNMGNTLFDLGPE
jgi:hypothetical protein